MTSIYITPPHPHCASATMLGAQDSIVDPVRVQNAIRELQAAISVAPSESPGPTYGAAATVSSSEPPVACDAATIEPDVATAPPHVGGAQSSGKVRQFTTEARWNGMDAKFYGSASHPGDAAKKAVRSWERKYGKVPEAVNVSTCADGENRTFNYTYTRDKHPNPSEHMQKYGMTDIVRLKAISRERPATAGGAM